MIAGPGGVGQGVPSDVLSGPQIPVVFEVGDDAGGAEGVAGDLGWRPMACYSYSIQEGRSKKVLTVASASVKAAGLTRDYAERFSKSLEDTYYCQTRQRPEVLEQETQEVEESTVSEVVRGAGFLRARSRNLVAQLASLHRHHYLLGAGDCPTL